jgi:predicted esterase
MRVSHTRDFRMLYMEPKEPQTDLAIKAEINLYYDLLVPDSAAGAAPLLIAVHGYGAHKRYMMREARLVAPRDWVIASIEGPHQHFRKTDDGYRVGQGWLTDHRSEENVRLHHHFLLELMDRLAADGTVDPKRVYLYGFSQACALNFRFAFTHPEAAIGIVGVCGGIPGDLETNERYGSPDASVLYLYGDDDEFYTPFQFAEYDRKLSARLPNYHSKQYKAKHEISQEMRSDIKKFLAQQDRAVV